MEVKAILDDFFLPRCQKWTPTGGVVVATEWRTFETARKLIAIIVLF